MKKNLQTCMVVFALFFINGLIAQNITVKGSITDEAGIPLPGVNVIEKGTSNGTTTDFDGNYTISASNSGILMFSYLGFTSKEVSINGQTTLDVILKEDAEQLNEVVVTALGIKKEKKALGYSLTEVGGEELSTIKTPNAINSLQGKIAGVNITQNATGAAGSSRVVIRGASSLTGSNQPLYVIDGIPMGNNNNGSASLWGGSDGGDGISSINPDNIESVSVLKGGAASALYGSRAAGGVILITTKNGNKEKGFGVEVSSSVTFDEVNTDIYEFQNQYGQGVLGRKPATVQEARDNPFSSWGARLDGSNAIQWDGVERPYSDTGSNIDSFYRTGTTFINTVAFSDASDKMSYRFSASDLSNEDIMPNADLNRKTFSINSSAILADKLTSSVNARYIVENTDNRPRLSDSPGNANFTVANLPANVDERFMKPGANEDLTERTISNGVFTQNPYFAAFNFRNEDVKTRIIASTTLRYDINDWLYLSGRAGVDHYTIKRVSVEPFGTAFIPLGSISENEIRYNQIDADLILGIDKDITEKLSTVAVFGANSNHIKEESLNLNGRNFIVPGLEDLGNVEQQSRSRNFSERKIGSLYGSVEFSYDDYAYVTFTGRNDWFSTLSFPGKESPNDDFYSSVSGSLILSELLELPSSVSFLKLRGGYSEVAGGAQDAFALALNFEIFGQGHLGQPLGQISGGNVPNLNLVPFSKTETEIGLDARFFNSRLNFDLAYYINNTKNDIVNVSTSQASGFSGASANIGEIENEGFEFLVRGIPIQTDNFKWTTSFNGSYNEGIVKATNDTDSNINLQEPRSRNVRITQIVGEAFGTIVGVSYDRDDNGNIRYQIDGDGVPLAVEGERKILGEGVPPWALGWTNTFSYKNFNLNVLIDAKFGAQIFSGTNTVTTANGLNARTLEGRENGLEVSGINADTGQAFTTTVAPEDLQTYWGRVSRIAEEFVEDADFIKLRQLSLGYSFPKKFLENTFITNVNVSFIASNLFYIKNDVDNISPESAFNVSNSQGLEYFGLPTTRTYGFNFNIKF